MEKKGIVSTAVGLGLSLLVLYVSVRVISSAWKSGQ
jgi:hypothetical protein